MLAINLGGLTYRAIACWVIKRYHFSRRHRLKEIRECSQIYFITDSGSEGISTRILSMKGAVLAFVSSRKGTTSRCACCEAKNVKLKGKVMRRFKSTPIGRKAVFIVVIGATGLVLGLRGPETGEGWLCR